MGRRQGGAGRGRLRAARSEDFLNRWPWSSLMIVIMKRTETNPIPGAGLILGVGRRPGWGTARGIICQGGMSDNYGNNTTYKWFWLRWTPASSVWTDVNDLDSIFRPSMCQLFQTWLPRFLTSSTGWLQQRVGEDCHGRGEGECSSISGSTAHCTHSAAQLHTDILCSLQRGRRAIADSFYLGFFCCNITYTHNVLCTW